MEAPFRSVQAGPAPDPSRESRDGTTAPPASASDREFRRLVETIPAIVYIETDEHPGPTTYISPRIEQVLGYPPEEFLADRGAWTRLVHPDDLSAVGRIEERSAQTY